MADDPTKLSRLELEAAYRANHSAVAVRDAAVVVPTPVETLAPVAEARPPPSGWRATEFFITAATTAFAMWVGYRVIIDPELDLQRAIAAVTGVVTVAWFYITKRTELKKVAADAGTTTIKTPGTVESGAGQNVMPLVRRNGRPAACPRRQPADRVRRRRPLYASAGLAGVLRLLPRRFVASRVGRRDAVGVAARRVAAPVRLANVGEGRARGTGGEQQDDGG
jgi:hypothetical protein